MEGLGFFTTFILIIVGIILLRSIRQINEYERDILKDYITNLQEAFEKSYTEDKVIDDDSDFSPCLNWGSSMEDVENYMKQFNWIKDYEDKWSVAYSNTGKTKGINYTFFQEKLEMVFYTFNYSEENLVKSIQEIKDKYGVTLEETVSFEDNDVMYKFEGEAIVNNEKCIINISTNKKRIIMISYYVIKE